MRTANNRRSWDPKWVGKHFLAACSLDPSLWEDAFNWSPYGLPKEELADFSISDFRELARWQGALGLLEDSDLQHAWDVTGGHPFLSQAVLEAVGREGRAVEEWIQMTLRGDGAAGQHLCSAANRVRPEEALYGKLIRMARMQGPDGLTGTEAAIAKCHGLIRRDCEYYVFRCPLYAHYFRTLTDR